eukprot:3087306-Pleurochrysis_carterae.AAC.1
MKCENGIAWHTCRTRQKATTSAPYDIYSALALTMTCEASCNAALSLLIDVYDLKLDDTLRYVLATKQSTF